MANAGTATGTSGGSEVSYYRTLSKLVEGKNINSTTLLATDYLNHFNELVMFLDLVPSMPEIIEDVKSWEPKSYVRHFADSVFTYRDLAITAYENSPQMYREPFDRVVDQMNRMVAEAIPLIEETIATGDPDRLEVEVAAFGRRLRARMDAASGIINASLEVNDFDDQQGRLDQSGVDALFD